jgi:hypothetical protein
MRKLLIGLALSLVATVAAAQAQWVFVVTLAKSGDKFYADPTTKRRTGNVVRIWEIHDFVNPDVSHDGKKAYYSIRSYVQYDCSERTRLYLEVTGFSGKMASGGAVGSDSQMGRKSFVAPGSSGERLFNFACQ